jgi:UDP-glucose 4-epimerase
MKVLITGALGYLGARLVAFLREQPGLELRLFVPEVPKELTDWVQGLDVREGDVTRPETLEGVGDGVDRVVHLAALNEVDCARDPVAAVRVNVEGTLHLMRSLTPSVAQVIYMSTFHVYGARAHGRVVEDTPLAPVHPYGATKAMGELGVTAHARQHGRAAVVLRASNGFGAPLYAGVDRWKLVVNNLCRQAIETRRLVVRTAAQARNFVGLLDIVQAIRVVLDAPPDGVDVLNVGGRDTVTIADVARQVQAVYRELYGQPLALEVGAAAEGSPPLDFCIDRLRARGYEPRVTLRDGIRETLRFCERLA